MRAVIVVSQGLLEGVYADEELQVTLIDDDTEEIQEGFPVNVGADEVEAILKEYETYARR